MPLSYLCLLLVTLGPTLDPRHPGPQSGQPPATQPATPPPDEGTPITNPLVVKHCGTCHKPDDKQRMSRISFRRTTPEGWQQTVRRMVTLNNVRIEAEAAREVVKYLADTMGLAPEEAKPAAFETERRLIDYKYAHSETEQTCIKCHSIGRVLTERRTKDEWSLLIAMHRGYYPLVDFQAFRRVGPRRTQSEADGRPPDNRHPYEKAIDHLSTAFPFTTPEWAAWSATRRPPRLEGTYALAGYQAGLGAVFGEMIVKAAPGREDEFTTEARYVYARSGRAVSRTGRALVYTGFQWRGRSQESGTTPSGGPGSGDNGVPASAPSTGELREVLSVDRDWRRMTGRWFTGGYDEIGIDITLERVGRDPIVLGVEPVAVRTNGRSRITIHGVNLPTVADGRAVDFGRGVSVTRIESSDPRQLRVEVEVAADAAVGRRDLFLAGWGRPAALTVYDRVDGLKVTPQAGMARVGGVTFPKQLQVFEATAYNHGPDGKPDTPDDLALGPAEVSWGLEEYTATFDDDDIVYVGAIDAGGVFTPAIEGPNPKRKNNANNIGDVWVVATLKGTGTPRPMRARAHLLVTVPLYMRWDRVEVAR